MLSEPSGLPTSLAHPTILIRGKSLMAEHIRARDWNSTPLGPIENWSEDLLCSINLMLGCAFPALIFWGKELVQFYNDAFMLLLAERHPSGLGQMAESCWCEAWEIIVPKLQRVIENGETVYQENALIQS